MMMTASSVRVTAPAQHRAWAARTLPPVERVRAGVWSVPVPIPNNPLRYVLAYVLELRDGIALVDTGWPVPEAWDVLVAGISKTGHEVADVRAVLVTHAHADHFGLAARVRAVSGAWVGLHEADARMLRPTSGEQLVARFVSWLTRHGVPAVEAAAITGSAADYEQFIGLGGPDRLIRDGEQPIKELPTLRAVWTPGHTPGHLCFYDAAARTMMTGDHVLPRISPNITVNDGDADPLGDYLASLRSLTTFDVQEVFPAHEYRFTGLAGRAGDLLAHHRARLDESLALVGQLPGSSTWELTERMTWSRPWSQTTGSIRRAAVGETLAHLVRLRAEGHVVRTDNDGVVRWWLTTSTA
jgi:glyoxylase-like metal-dependent hydrolase (beta-lactamase superfamily II)